jgi:hypothetical protein
MIIYNVTVNVDDAIAKEWVIWMRDIHIPEVIATGMFVSHTFSKLLSRQEDETGTTYVIQYMAPDMQHYERYQAEFASALQTDAKNKFGDRFVAFRTLMEQV